MCEAKNMPIEAHCHVMLLCSVELPYKRKGMHRPAVFVNCLRLAAKLFFFGCVNFPLAPVLVETCQLLFNKPHNSMHICSTLWAFHAFEKWNIARYLAAVRLQPCPTVSPQEALQWASGGPTVSPQEAQDVKNAGDWHGLSELWRLHHAMLVAQW